VRGAEDWPEIFIGCAGGGDSKLALPVAFSPVPAGAAAFQVTVSGGRRRQTGRQASPCLDLRTASHGVVAEVVLMASLACTCARVPRFGRRAWLLHGPACRLVQRDGRPHRTPA